MQIGESVAVVVAMQEDNKCVFCSQEHENPKKEDVKETAPSDTGWKRKSMKKVFEKTPEKLAIYPDNSFPPSYEHQGHHCMALSSFVRNADLKTRTDKRIRLNHFLKKVGFFPNRDKNSIGLPERKSNGDFEAFWLSFDAGKPLQLHGPGHDSRYFMQVTNLINRMLGMITAPNFCEALTKNEWEDALKVAIESAENFAFNKLASNKSSWCLHVSEQKKAKEIYKAPVDHVFRIDGANKSKVNVNGQGNIDANIVFPNPQLDEGPFRGA